MVLSPSRLFLRVLITIWAAVAATAQAGPVHYTLELPAEQRLAFRVEFEVAFPGTVTVDADWSPGRVLVFRLERPGRPALRRSGPPPMHMELDVAQGELDRDDPWTLVINGLPTREAAGGRLLLGLPDAPSTHASEPDAGPQSPAAHTEPWMLPVTIPSGLEPGYRRMLETTETFRELVVDEATPDAYGWQVRLTWRSGASSKPWTGWRRSVFRRASRCPARPRPTRWPAAPGVPCATRASSPWNWSWDRCSTNCTADTYRNWRTNAGFRASSAA
jgi:hypothetical protein